MGLLGYERVNFYNSGPLDLTAVDWTISQHRRIVAASLVQGTYSMEDDRRLKLQGHLPLAPPWWESFNFQPVQVLHDKHDHSIFGAIFEFKFTPSNGNYLRQNPPRFVVAFRGTIIKTDTCIQDIILDIQLFMRNELQVRTRVQLAMQAVKYWVSIAGAANIWLAGHSLGSAIALVAGKNMVKEEGCFIETYLFNPPFTAFPTVLFKNEKIKHGIRFTTNVIKAGVAVAVNSQHQRSQKDHSFNVLSSWIPYLFVNPSDTICSEYISYFEDRRKMVEVGLVNIARLATQNSLGNLILGATRTDSEPPHLIPSAHLTINVSPTQGLKQAHGIQQWWKQNINCQFKQHQYREMSWHQRHGYGLEGSEEMSWYGPQPRPSLMGPIIVSPQFMHPTHNAISLHGYEYVEETSNPNNQILAIQGSNGQLITSNGYGHVERTLNPNNWILPV